MSRTHLSARHFAPLAGFVVPTVVIGYGFVIPGSCIAGVNELTLGFASAIAGACVSYWLGLRALAREGRRSDEA
jgi:ABC-type Fe3+ transport system permease subunit